MMHLFCSIWKTDQFLRILNSSIPIYEFWFYVECSIKSKTIYFNFQKRKVDSLDEELLKALKKPDLPAEDEWDYFCRSLAPKLRRINSVNPVGGTAIQFKILQIVHETELSSSTMNE